ncbi:tRNA pseudouridine synthase B [Buchnera aphidicola (Tetraneura ulmi)]|uniref:tRNA pseudouridine(55) synthase TruB n=1 Tax=Buchnera aphidicola TaxID=9 RepID=UPI0034644831
MNLSKIVNNGVLLLDKPKLHSSNSVLQYVKKIFKIKKAGYIGTLDPLATGMLPICFGESTKFLKYLSNAKKRYLVIAKLGVQTTTFDSLGEVIKKTSIINIKKDFLKRCLKKFIGKIEQIPPMYSALKHKGIPLYKYARKGITIFRKTRKITIYELDYIIHNNNFIKLKILCSTGTYVRTLIDDLGKLLGCGAHIVYLRRLEVSFYLENQLVSLNIINRIKNYFYRSNSLSYLNFFRKIILPTDSLLSNFPIFKLNDCFSFDFSCGKKISIFIKKKNKTKLVRVLKKSNNKFLGVGKIQENNLLIPIRLISSF